MADNELQMASPMGENAENKAPETKIGDENKEPKTQTPAKTFTQEELNKIVSERVKTERAKLEKKFADDAAEAAKVASMNAEEKAKHEAEKREKELSEREKELAKREKIQLAKELLAEKNLPAALLPAVDISGDESAMSKSAEALAKAFSDAVSAEVSKKLAGEAPKKSSPAGSKDPFLSGLGI